MFSDIEHSALWQWLLQSPNSLTMLALLCSCSGIALLWYSWQDNKKTLFTIGLAWVFVLLAFPLWTINHGIEFGVTYNFIFLALAAWFIIIISNKPQKNNYQRYSTATTLKSKTTKSNDSEKQKTSTEASIKWLRAGKFFSVIIIGSLSSLTITTLFFLTFASVLANQMAYTALAFPLVWGVLSVWITFTHRLARTSILLFIIGTAATWLILS